MKLSQLKLEESIISPQDVKSTILNIREYALWFNHNAIKQRLHAGHHKTSEAPALTPGAAALIRDWSAKTPLSQQRFDELLAALQKVENTAPQITITLAAPPAGSIKKTLVAWCRANIASDILVSFQFNSTILGGMVVRSGSHVFDWSFRRQILANRQKFPEVLRRV